MENNIKKQYETLRDEILDVKKNAVLSSDEEQAKEKFNSIIYALMEQAKKKQELSTTVFLRNEVQADILSGLLEQEKISSTKRTTSLSDTPIALDAFIPEEEKTFKPIKKFRLFG